MENQAKHPEPKQSEKVSPEKNLMDWDELLREIDFLSLKLLDHIYLKDQLTLHKLSQDLTKFGVSTATIKNRLVRLEDWNLIELVTGSNPLCLTKKLKIEERIKKLIILGYGKFEVSRDG